MVLRLTDRLQPSTARTPSKDLTTLSTSSMGAESSISSLRGALPGPQQGESSIEDNVFRAPSVDRAQLPVRNSARHVNGSAGGHIRRVDYGEPDGDARPRALTRRRRGKDAARLLGGRGEGHHHREAEAPLFSAAETRPEVSPPSSGRRRKRSRARSRMMAMGRLLGVVWNACARTVKAVLRRENGSGRVKSVRPQYPGWRNHRRADR